MNELSSWYTSSSTYPSLKMKKTIAFGHYSTFSPFIQNDWRTHLLSILFTQHATFQTKSSLKRVKIYVKLTVTARWNHHCQKKIDKEVEKKNPRIWALDISWIAETWHFTFDFCFAQSNQLFLCVLAIKKRKPLNLLLCGFQAQWHHHHHVGSIDHPFFLCVLSIYWISGISLFCSSGVATQLTRK